MIDSYILCTAPRSGSTLLCSLLSSTGVAGQPGSHMHRPDPAAWARTAGLPDEPTPPLPRIIDAIRQTGRGNTPVFGLRLQRGSAPFALATLAQLHPHLTSDRARIEATFGRTRYLHLTRQNKVQQAISHVIANQSGLWHRAPDGAELERLAPHRTPAYDRAAIQSSLDLFRANDAAWADWFAAEALDPVRLTYEALAADPIGTLRDVLSALGLDPAAADRAQPGVTKLADARSAEWEARFRAGV